MRFSVRSQFLNAFLCLLMLVVFFGSKARGQIPCLAGFVHDSNGAPVAGVDLDFDDPETGERIYTPGDNTDQDGFYRVCVLPGTYHVSFGPAPGTHLLGRQFFNFPLYSSQELNVTLDFGVVISGIVTDPLGTPIGNVDLDADSLSGGGRVYTPNDDTDSASGIFWIVVPPESYRLRFQPPVGSRWRGLQIDSLTVLSDTSMDVILEQGMLLSGLVTDGTGQGLEGISVDLRVENTGEKIYVANNKTDQSGYFNVAVPPGLFELRFEPPPGSRLVGVAVDSFAIEADAVWDQALETGLLVTALVRDSLGDPIQGADLDFIHQSTGIRIFTPHDKTDASGLATLSVLPDTYSIRVDPPIGSMFDRVVVSNVALHSDTTLDFLLPGVEKVQISGRIVNSWGEGLHNIEVDLADTLTGATVYIPNNETDSAGFYDLWVPIGSFDALFAPARGSRYVGKLLSNIIITEDASLSDVVLDTGLVFSAQVLDPQNQAVADVDFDFIPEGTGAEIFTPHDNTDASGAADITIPSGTYTIRLRPPAGTPFGELLLAGFDITTDTSVAFFLTDVPETTPDTDESSLPAVRFILKDNFPNPFTEATTFSYVLFVQSDVEINIYNILGHRIKSIKGGVQSPGHHVLLWDGRNDSGNGVASGIYFYQLKTNHGVKNRKMILIR